MTRKRQSDIIIYFPNKRIKLEFDSFYDYEPECCCSVCQSNDDDNESCYYDLEKDREAMEREREEWFSVESYGLTFNESGYWD